MEGGSIRTQASTRGLGGEQVAEAVGEGPASPRERKAKNSPDRSLLSMRRRSESTQKSLPSSLSMARATGLPSPLKNSTSRSVPSRAARSILGERSSRLVKYMYLRVRDQEE